MSYRATGKTEHKCTGFVSPAQGYEDQAIDLNKLLVRNPPATYFFWLETTEMENAGIPKGSLLIVDRSQKPKFNNLVLIKHENSFMCRLMLKEQGKTIFSNGKNSFLPIENDTEIIGAIIATIQTYDLPH